MNKQNLKLVGIIGGSVVAGFGAGWIAANKSLSAKYAAMLEVEVETMREYFGQTHNRLVFATPGDAVEALIPEFDPVHPNNVRSEYDTTTVEDPEDIVPLVDTRHNIFEEARELSAEELNQQDGNASPRDPDHPYLITVGEFQMNELGYEQILVDYFEADDTLADENEQQVPDVEYTIGEKHLELFGEKSGDKDTVYVRNEKLMTDFEVTRHDGAYAVEVLGVDPKLLDPPAKARTRKKSERDN